MLMTERKAITLILEQLMDEERDLKNYYRAEKARIENQKNDLLNRLERLDNLEREAVDTEGILQSMAATADKLAELLPAVPAEDMIERAAQLVAAEAIESGAEIKGSEQIQAEKEEEKKDLVKKEAAAIKPVRAAEIKDDTLPGGQYLLEKIEEVIRESKLKAMTAKDIKAALSKKYGWKMDKFNGSFGYVKKTFPDRLIKRGMFYSLKEAAASNKPKDQGATNENDRQGTRSQIQENKEAPPIF